MGLLPTKMTSISTNDPKNLIIFSSPKGGKTSALSKLDGCLIVDMENGSNYVSGYIVKANNIYDLYNIAKELKEGKHEFKFVALDTVTALEEMSCELACKLYVDTPMGKAFQYKNPTDILKLPNGAGYLYLRLAMQQIIGWFESTGLNVILVGHTKDKTLTDNNKEELNVRTLDLSGKISNILSAKSDAIGFLYRNAEENKVYVNFGDNTSIICSARPEHLQGKTILLSEKQDDGTLITHWENIYPSLKK